MFILQIYISDKKSGNLQTKKINQFLASSGISECSSVSYFCGSRLNVRDSQPDRQTGRDKLYESHTKQFNQQAHLAHICFWRFGLQQL